MVASSILAILTTISVTVRAAWMASSVWADRINIVILVAIWALIFLAATLFVVIPEVWNDRKIDRQILSNEE